MSSQCIITVGRSAAALPLLLMLLLQLIQSADAFSAINPSANTNTKPDIKTFHFGAGCFWAPADNIKKKPGIISTSVGYCGDDTITTTPSYEKVCGGYTRLVEAVRVEYDANQLTFEELMPMFSEVNTAEYGNKRQYAGIIFTSSEEESNIATEYLNQNKHVIATVEDMSDTFYTAENYHQDYWSKWRTRVPLFIASLFLISKFGGDMSQTISNVVCYGFIGFILIERRFDNAVEKIIVGKE